MRGSAWRNGSPRPLAVSRRAHSFFLRLIWREVFEQRVALQRLLLAAGLEAVCAVVGPWTTARVIDTAIPAAAPRSLATLSVVLVVAAAHGAWATWLHSSLSIALRHRVEARCLGELLIHFLRAPYSRVANRLFGATSETFASASAVVVTLVTSVLGTAISLMTGFLAFVALCSCSRYLALLAAAVALVLAAVTTLLSLREGRITERMLDVSAQAHQLLHVALSALPTLRASGATERLVERWADACGRRTRDALDCENLRLDRAVAIQTGRQLMAWATSAALAWQVLDGEASLGTLMFATMLVGQVLQRLLDALQGLMGWVDLAPHRARVDSLLAELGNERAAPTTKLRNYHVAIEASGLCVRFGVEQPWILDRYSVRVAPAQHLVLTGASGSGKSTLLRVIAGLVLPERGRVEVFGVDPFAEPGLVAYVPQRASLLEASIATNLTVLSGASLEQALIVAQSTGLARMLSRLPMGHETLVAAGGSNLSAGQQQLILLTAAFASGRPVVLLDEVTSQLDAETRSKIRWDVLEQGRTIVSVRHE